MAWPHLEFATPRKLPRPREVDGRVVVLDIAFASEASGGGFEKITRPFIDGLGARLAAWVDHHDHTMHASYRDDPRFVLCTKAEHGACPEMVTPELVQRTGAVDTIVCHSDFDGLASAAKWIRGGSEAYPGADDDARAVDTRIGRPGPVGQRIDRALRGRGRDPALYGLIVRHLVDGLRDASMWGAIDEAGRDLLQREEAARAIAARYTVLPAAPPFESVAFVDATPEHGRYDKTALLLIGQERARVALLVDGDNLSLAASFGSGLNFLELMSLSGGMPTLVSVPRAQLDRALDGLGVAPGDRSRIR